VSYFDKLRDVRWQKKRLEILNRAGFACEWCGRGEGLLRSGDLLHVHHGYYVHGADPWDYEDSTLWCLCDSCHRQAEEVRGDLYREIAKVHPAHHGLLMMPAHRLWGQSVSSPDASWPEVLAEDGA